MRKVILRISIAAFLVIVFTQCKKTSIAEAVPDNDSKRELSVARKEALTEILVAAKNDEFRQFILAECLRQKHGDYNVYLKDVILHFNGVPGYEKITASLERLVVEIKQLANGREPLIFYPKAETIETNLRKRDSEVSMRPLLEPIGVYEGVFNPDYSSPGYIVDNGYNLIYYQDITEDYAWENDVWVIGEEENVSPDNMIAAREDLPLLIAERYEGQSEYGGIIQCTDLNAIEHWTAGKLEFKFFAFDANGIERSKRAFGKWKRSNFRDRKWKDFGHFISYWYTSTFGKWMIENWWEEDGGQSSSVTITMPPPSGVSGPAISTTIPSKDRDDDLGIATIQFTDPITQIYNISYANIKRKN